MSNNISLICYEYNLNRVTNSTLLNNFILKCQVENDNNVDLFVGNMIREVLYMRDYGPNFFSKDEYVFVTFFVHILIWLYNAPIYIYVL